MDKREELTLLLHNTQRAQVRTPVDRVLFLEGMAFNTHLAALTRSLRQLKGRGKFVLPQLPSSPLLRGVLREVGQVGYVRRVHEQLSSWIAVQRSPQVRLCVYVCACVRVCVCVCVCVCVWRLRCPLFCVRVLCDVVCVEIECSCVYVATPHHTTVLHTRRLWDSPLYPIPQHSLPPSD